MAVLPEKVAVSITLPALSNILALVAVQLADFVIETIEHAFVVVILYPKLFVPLSTLLYVVLCVFVLCA